VETATSEVNGQCGDCEEHCLLARDPIQHKSPTTNLSSRSLNFGFSQQEPGFRTTQFHMRLYLTDWH